MLQHTEQDTQTEQKHKSVELSASLIRKIKAEVRKYPNQDLAAKAIGLNDRFILARILKQKTASSDTVAIIEEKIGTAA